MNPFAVDDHLIVSELGPSLTMAAYSHTQFCVGIGFRFSRVRTGIAASRVTGFNIEGPCALLTCL